MFGGVEINATFGNAVVSTFAGSKVAGGHLDGVGSAARLIGPAGMGSDGIMVYFAEPGSHTLRSVNPASALVTTLSGTAYSPGDSASQMRHPLDVVPSGGGFFVSEGLNHAISSIFPPLRVVAAGDVNIAGAYGDGAAATARFFGPSGLALVGTDLYIADTNNHVIRKFDSLAGNVSTFAGRQDSSGTQDGPALTATFAGPSALATDGVYLYVGDLQGLKIRRVNLASGVVSTLSGAGTLGGQVDGTAAEAQFGAVKDLAISGGYLYVADWSNHAVRKVSTATGNVTTVAGRRDRAVYVDGAGSSAGFAYPAGLAIVGASMFVTDPDNFVIRKITNF